MTKEYEEDGGFRKEEIVYRRKAMIYILITFDDSMTPCHPHVVL